MIEPTLIDVSVLRVRLDSFLRDLEQQSPTVAVRSDLYWFLPVHSAFDVYQPPEPATIGSVTDAWEGVDRDSDHVDYELIWFADLLRALGRELTS